jgi:hypothetical protein
MLPYVPPRSYFGPTRTEPMYTFVAPTFIERIYQYQDTRRTSLLLSPRTIVQRPTNIHQMQRQPPSRDTATRDATTEPRHTLSIMAAIHTQQSPMGFLVSPSPTDNVCDVPHRRALGPNSIISHANLFTDTPACYHRCQNILTDHQTASSTVAPTLCRRNGSPLTQPDKV